MGLLDDDHYVPPFTPSRELVRQAKYQSPDNFQALQMLGRKERSEDFEDSPHADRTPLEEEE